MLAESYARFFHHYDAAPVLIGQLREPQLRRARRRLRAAGRPAARDEEPSRVLQPRLRCRSRTTSRRSATPAPQARRGGFRADHGQPARRSSFAGAAGAAAGGVHRRQHLRQPAAVRSGEDFDRYPRTFERDCRMLEAEGVRLVFAPDEKVLYPQPQTYRVSPPPMAEELEGRFRPGFFTGVVHRGAQAPELRAARGRGIRQEGLPAARADAGHGAPARPAGPDRARRDGAGGRRAGDELAQRLPLARRSAPRLPGCTGPCARSRTAS